MKIILTMSTSLDGFIATKAGSEDFIADGSWQEFISLSQKIGCFIWGRKTYENVLSWADDSLDTLKGVTKLVLTSSQESFKKGFIAVSSPEEAIELCENKGFKEMIITGGATLNKEFAIRNLIDEIIFNVSPVVLGDGIPVFAPDDFQLYLSLIETEQVYDGIVKLRYTVNK